MKIKEAKPVDTTRTALPEAEQSFGIMRELASVNTKAAIMWITAKISIQRFVKHISPCIHLHIVKSNRTNNKNPNSQDRIGFKQKKKIITYSSTISKGFPFELHASFHSIIFYKYKKVLISPFNLRLTKLLTESKCANMYFS